MRVIGLARLLSSALNATTGLYEYTFRQTWWDTDEVDYVDATETSNGIYSGTAQILGSGEFARSVTSASGANHPIVVLYEEATKAGDTLYYVHMPLPPMPDDGDEYFLFANTDDEIEWKRQTDFLPERPSSSSAYVLISEDGDLSWVLASSL